MASNGKRMVKEDLIKKLENLPEGLEVVEANSTDEATETLTKLTVGDTVYSVPQGGGTNTHLYTISFLIDAFSFTLLSKSTENLDAFSQYILYNNGNLGLDTTKNNAICELLASNNLSYDPDGQVVSIIGLNQASVSYVIPNFSLDISDYFAAELGGYTISNNTLSPISSVTVEFAYSEGLDQTIDYTDSNVSVTVNKLI